ncbi:MAG: CHAT domain-containing protein, partial [bacterium]
LLEYALGYEATYLFVVKKGGVVKIMKIAKGQEEIERMVNAFMLPLQNPMTKEDFSPFLGQQLYSIILEKALEDVSVDKNIIIIPDGILGLLPFEALVIELGRDFKSTVFVGDRWNICYYQSATILAFNRLLKPTRAQKPLFALGNPIFDKSDPRYVAFKEGKSLPAFPAQESNLYAYRALATQREWGTTTQEDDGRNEIVYPPLYETEKEVKEIATLFNVGFSPPDILLNVDANETSLRKSQLRDYRFLHFATHADLPGKVEGIKESFLLLGQVGNEGKDDGFLTMTEVLELSLDADLVVLSACLTGRGAVMEGEGVLNFARAFHHAGARSVVVSLWEVASKETAEYMKLFYQHLKEGMSKERALFLARREIKSKYPNPFYWAPFILHGES